MPRIVKSMVEAERLNNRHCSFVTPSSVRIPFSTTMTRFNKTVGYDKKETLSHNVHLGQRKLLLSEIQLLTLYYNNNVKSHPIVVYVGASPGTHLDFLHYLFPNVKFILYDASPIKLKNNDVYEIYKQYFTDETCIALKQRFAKSPNVDMLFVSDIRLGANSNKEFEDQVLRDNELQLGWMKILKPKYSLIKFRLSYNLKHGQTFEYVKGKVMFQMWPPETSGESRLLVTRANITTKHTYDFKNYEETLFFHNKWTRRYCFPIESVFDDDANKANDAKSANANALQMIKKQVYADNNLYCTCYDCMAELYTLQEYVKLANSGKIVSIKPKTLNTIINEIQKPIYKMAKKTIPSGDQRVPLTLKKTFA